MTRPHAVATTCMMRCENALYEQKLECDPMNPILPFENITSRLQSFQLCYAVAERCAQYTGKNLDKLSQGRRFQFISQEYSCPDDDGVEMRESVPKKKFLQFIRLLWGRHCRQP